MLCIRICLGAGVQNSAHTAFKTAIIASSLSCCAKWVHIGQITSIKCASRRHAHTERSKVMRIARQSCCGIDFSQTVQTLERQKPAQQILHTLSELSFSHVCFFSCAFFTIARDDGHRTALRVHYTFKDQLDENPENMKRSSGTDGWRFTASTRFDEVLVFHVRMNVW